jgi:hypothetical protein
MKEKDKDKATGEQPGGASADPLITELTQKYETTLKACTELEKNRAALSAECQALWEGIQNRAIPTGLVEGNPGWSRALVDLGLLLERLRELEQRPDPLAERIAEIRPMPRALVLPNGNRVCLSAMGGYGPGGNAAILLRGRDGSTIDRWEAPLHKPEKHPTRATAPNFTEEERHKIRDGVLKQIDELFDALD